MVHTAKAAAVVLGVAAALGCAGGSASGLLASQTTPSGEWVSPDAEDADRPEQAVGAISGSLVDDATGNPVAMASISAFRDGELVRGDLSTGDGNFYIRDLLPGSYQVVAARGGDEKHFPSVAVLAGEESKLSIHFDARERLDAGSGPATGTDRGALEGVVRDGPKGPGFPGAVIALSSPDLADALMALTNEDGSFHFPDLPPATYDVSCYYHLIDKGNVEVRRSGLIVVSGETTRVELDLDLTINR